MLIVLCHIISREGKEWVQVVWFSALLLRTPVVTQVLEQIHASILWHVDCLNQIFTLPDILDGVLLKECHVAMTNQHNWNYCLVKDIVDEWLQLQHCALNFARGCHKLDDEVKSF